MSGSNATGAETLAPEADDQAARRAQLLEVSRRSQIRFRSEMRLVTRRLAAMMPLDGSMSRKDYVSVVAELIARRGKRLATEVDFYCRCFGAFPSLVKLVMLTLAEEGKIVGSSPHNCTCDVSGPVPWEYDDFDPVEYEWYFDAQSVRTILGKFPASTRSVVSLSVPTIVAEATAAGHRVTLLDRSPSLMHKNLGLRDSANGESPTIVPWDLGKAPYRLAEPADVVVMDPPWYLDHYRAWLHTATAACKEGGLIMVALPELLTNRRTFSERRDLMTTLDGIGPVQIVRHALSYVTPSFERAVLEIDNLDHLARWRRADLAVVVKRASEPLHSDFARVNDSDWTYRRVDGRVIRTWGEVSSDAVPVIAKTDATLGFRMTSVSRSYLASSEINLVTSGGRAVVVQRWGQLPQILDSLQDEIHPEKAIDHALPGASTSDRAGLAKDLRALLRR
jgi:hypothetical protein